MVTSRGNQINNDINEDENDNGKAAASHEGGTKQGEEIHFVSPWGVGLTFEFFHSKLAAFRRRSELRTTQAPAPNTGVISQPCGL